jgi:hypothetical protein
MTNARDYWTSDVVYITLRKWKRDVIVSCVRVVQRHEDRVLLI